MPKTQNNFPTVIWVDGTMKHENFHRLGKTTPMQFWFSSITIYHAKSELFTLFPSLIRNDPSIKIFFCESPVNGKNVPVNYWLSSNCNNFYQNLPIFWHGYIRDIMQLCVTFGMMREDFCIILQYTTKWSACWVQLYLDLYIAMVLEIQFRTQRHQ